LKSLKDWKNELNLQYRDEVFAAIKSGQYRGLSTQKTKQLLRMKAGNIYAIIKLNIASFLNYHPIQAVAWIRDLDMRPNVQSGFKCAATEEYIDCRDERDWMIKYWECKYEFDLEDPELHSLDKKVGLKFYKLDEYGQINYSKYRVYDFPDNIFDMLMEKLY